MLSAFSPLLPRALLLALAFAALRQRAAGSRFVDAYP